MTKTQVRQTKSRRLEKMVPCTVDLYPTFKTLPHQMKRNYSGMAYVALLEYLDKSGWGVCVWGDDDCGYERLFTQQQFDRAVQLFNSIYEITSHQGLKDMGLQSA